MKFWRRTLAVHPWWLESMIFITIALPPYQLSPRKNNWNLRQAQPGPRKIWNTRDRSKSKHILWYFSTIFYYELCYILVFIKVMIGRKRTKNNNKNIKTIYLKILSYLCEFFSKRELNTNLKNNSFNWTRGCGLNRSW